MTYSNIVQNRTLYILLLILSIFLLLTAFGSGLFGTGNRGIIDWQHKAFSMLCHQDISRSFWISGQPMAVCSRCFGIYLALTFSLLSMPLWKPLVEKTGTYNHYILTGAVLLNIVDMVGNLLGFWQNTLLTRSVLGTTVGFAVVLLLAEEFLDIQSKFSRSVYGFHRSK